MEKPIVSILTITYNHAQFIAQAIDSFLMQKTTFNFEIVIGEDCSTDNTRKIILDYQSKYPDKIKLLKKDKNLGIESNFFKTLQACKGKYIAICDGDDYWTDDKKLQKQVSFLENHKDYGMVATLEKNYIQSENKFINSSIKIEKEFKILLFKDFLFQNKVTASTVLFKNELAKEYSDLYLRNKTKLSFLDYSLWLYFSYKEKVAVLNQYTTVYRILKVSASHFTKNNKWLLDHKFYNDILFYKNNYSTLDNEMIDKTIYARAIKYYISACYTKDKKTSQEFLKIFKKNKDYSRYALLKIGLPFYKFIGYAHFIEKLNIKLNKKLLKNVDTYFEE